MNDKIKRAFDQIQAEETLKRTTKDYLRQRIRQTQTHRSGFRRYLLPAMACFLFVLLGVGGYRLYFTPISVISIDINPSVEWNINRFDKIISVKNYNEDGEKLSETLDVTNKNYQEALNMLVSNSAVKEYLAQDEYLSITVVVEDEAQNDQMLQAVRSCTSGIRNAHCSSADYSELEAAHETGLSCGKYHAYLLLQSLDPSITPDQIRQMTMRQIRELIGTLTEDGSRESDSNNAPETGYQTEEHGWGNGSSSKGIHGHGSHHNQDD